MLPLKDTVRARTFPVVNVGIIALNLLVFFVELRLPPAARDALLWLLGVVPARLLSPPVLSPDLLTLLTSQFLHGGWLHVGSNMLALYIFGDNVEDRLGHAGYLLFYLACGLAGGLAHVWSDPTSPAPALGASGAIAGVMAAYVVLFPTARVTTLVPIFFIPWFVDIPALLWAGGWFLTQLVSGVETIASEAKPMGGVGYWAHVGGFVGGLLLVWPLRRPEPRFHADQYWPW